MEFKEFVKEYRRICVAHPNCLYCELGRATGDMPCDKYVLLNPDEAERIISEWSKAHPVKTRQSELLKLFPNAEVSLGYIDICPRIINKEFKCPNDTQYRDCEKACWDCRKEYWLSEIEQGE